jgi:hypothetical protein
MARILVAAVLSTFVVLAKPAFGEIVFRTGDWLSRTCWNPSSRIVCDAYVSGAVDSLIQNDSYVLHLCYPAGATREWVVHAVIAALPSQPPKLFRNPAAEVVRLTMFGLWACKPP